MAEGASLTVMGGPLAGTVLVIDDAVDEILVGSDPDCRLSIDLPGVSPIHARVWRDLAGITVYDTRSARGLFVNDDQVVDQAQLRDGDVLWLGPPGDPDSVMIQCRLPQETDLGTPAIGETPPLDVGEESGVAPSLEDLVPSEPLTEWSDGQPAEDLVGAPRDLLRMDPLPIDPLSIDPLPIDALPVDPLPVDELAMAELPMEAPPMDALPAEKTSGAPVDFLLDAPAPERKTGAPVIPEPVSSPPVISAAVISPPVISAPTLEAPATAAPAEAEEFVMDPEWAESDVPGEPETIAPTPFDLDSLLGDDAEPVAIPPRAPEHAVVPQVAARVPDAAPDAAVPPAAVPPAAAPTAAAVPRQTGGAPPLVAAPTRAVIDDTRPRPAARPVPKREAPEGVMDWARGNSTREDSAIPAARPSSGPSSRAPERSGRGKLLPIAGVMVALAAIGGGYFAWSASRVPRIDGVTPARATTGNVITLTGAHLGETVAQTSASIGGRPARVVQAGVGSLRLEVPELPAIPGRDSSVPVVVTTSRGESNAATIGLFQAPRLKAIVPDVGMPGENVVLTGTSLATGATVRFGDLEAAVVQAADGSLTVTVPALTVAPGTEVPVVTAMGADPSNALPFVVGKVPMLTAIEPRSASPGDLVTVTGRGFNAQPAANVVRVDGAPALVISASARGLQFVVPRVTGGVGAITIGVPGSEHVAREEISIALLPEPATFQFVAEPFADVPGHEHAAVSTGLGPAFIVTTAQGKSAAERAYEAQKRLNDAAQVLRSTRTAEIRARYAPTPAVYLFPRDTVLLDVTSADAEGYNESWVPARARGNAVTPARLAAWWEAVARDLVLLLLRGEKPTHAQALAPEGKVLADVHDAARRTVAVGVPAALITGAKPPMREALRAVALRVPPSVAAPVAVAEGAAAAPASAAPGVPALKLDGSWRGSETESGVPKLITITFAGGSGTLTYERALAMSVPVLAVQPQKAAVRFEVRVGAGTRYYRGQWDGTRITGKLSSDPEGRAAIGTFELDPGR